MDRDIERLLHSRARPRDDGGERRGLGLRADLCFLVIFATLVGLGVRLYMLQCLAPPERVRAAREQGEHQIRLPARRGPVFDSRMRCLARSVPVEAICASLPEIRDPAAAAERLSPLLGVSKEALFDRLISDGRQKWVYLRRRTEPELAGAVRELGIPGIVLEQELSRAYPLGRATCHLVGLVRYDGGRQQGVEGIERAFDRVLRGRDGWEVVRRGSRGGVIPTGGLSGREPLQGQGVVLTVDACIQQIAREELMKAVRAHEPKAAWAVALDPRSGAILALVSWPDFDPNERSDMGGGAMRSRPCTDVIEPGSAFKPFVVAAAREAGLVEWDEEFFCENGAWQVGRRIIRDHKPFGMLACADGLIVSSNIWAVKVGLRLGPERLHEALVRFGFGRKTGVPIPGESRGIVRPPERWTSYSTASISFGQEIAVTPLQLALGYAALVNGGVLLRPYLVRAVTDADGRIVEHLHPKVVRRVLSPQCSAEMRWILGEVVSRGTGRKARCAEYALGGKTGTSQKAEGGRYVPGKFVGTFVGFGPVEEPRLVVLVSLDETRGEYYGGMVAAPAAGAILRRVLIHLNVPQRTERGRVEAPAARPRRRLVAGDAQ